MPMRPAYITALVFAAILLTQETAVNAETIYGLTNVNNGQRVFSFDSTTPGTIVSSHSLSGLLGTDSIAGIDIRPTSGELYGVSNNNLSPGNHIYTIEPTTGIATLVSTITSAQPLPTLLNPSGIDFDPVDGSLRLVNFF